MQAEQPADDVERYLVVKMARAWLSDRAVRLQEACFTVSPRTAEEIRTNRETVSVRKDIHVYTR